MTIQEAKNKVVTLANAEVGYREGSSNYNKYADSPDITRLYGWNPQNQPWCCVFVNWVFLTAFGYDLGSRLTYGGTAACNNSAQLFKSAGAWSSFPQVGDQAFYFSGGGINHTGVVVEVDGSVFYAIEGNYSDKVSKVKRAIAGNDIAGFGRPRWELVANVADTDVGNIPENPTEKPEEPIEDHSWKPPLLRQSNSYKPDVVVLQALLNVKGFPCGEVDGQYGPKTATAVSRAQYFYKLEQDCICGQKTWAKLLEIKKEK